MDFRLRNVAHHQHMFALGSLGSACVISGGKREDYQNCSLLYCVLKLRTVISTLRRAVLTVLWIGFCLTVHRFICVYVCVLCLCCHTAYVSYYCNMMGEGGWPGGIEE